MKLKTLIEKLQKIEKANGGNISVRARDYRGCFSPLSTVNLTEFKTIWIDAK